MPSYLQIRKWVDRDISSSRGRPVSLIFPFPLAIMLAFAMPFTALWIVMALLVVFPSIIWSGFVIWRCWRMAKASQLRSARYYERFTRYSLPAEYADSEDAWLAKRRRAGQGHADGHKTD